MTTHSGTYADPDRGEGLYCQSCDELCPCEVVRLREAFGHIAMFVDKAQLLSDAAWRRKMSELLQLLDLGALMAGVEPYATPAEGGK